jgi:hypothetical protein
MECREVFSYRMKKRKFCSSSCAAKYNNKIRTKQSRDKQRASILISKNKSITNTSYYENYRSLCRFKINQTDYHKIKNYHLYLKFGTFNKNNKQGVAIDHIFSINDGFKHHINPKIISHPINAQFLLYGENSRKNKKSEITIEELLYAVQNNIFYNLNIDNEQKYNNVYNLIGNKGITEEIDIYPYCSVSWSYITGRPFNLKLSPPIGWNNPNKSSAKILSRMFDFELGDPYDTERNILLAIEHLQKLYDNGMSPKDIKEYYGIEYSSFGMFLTKCLGLRLKNKG